MQFKLTKLLVASACAAVLLSLSFTAAPAAPSVAIEPSLQDQLLTAINADRAQAGVAPLVIDSRLTALAEQRDEYMIEHGYFSHCLDGSPSCDSTQYHFGILLAQSGFGGLAAAENLAANNDDTASASVDTNSDWLNSPGHRTNLLNGTYNATGLSTMCCTTMFNASGVRIVTQIFVQETPEMLQEAQENETTPLTGATLIRATTLTTVAH